MQFVDYDRFVGDFADDYRVFDKLGAQLVDSGADAAVIAVGACGRCTAGVMRAAAVSESVSIPAVAVVSSGFESMARAMATIFGDGEPRLAVYPGAIQTDTQATFESKLRGVVAEIERALLSEKVAAAGSPVAAPAEPEPRTVVFTGSLDEIEEHFIEQGWGDGLPVVPPTVARVERFLDQVALDPTPCSGSSLPSSASSPRGRSRSTA